jgi:hypothetical protein
MLGIGPRLNTVFKSRWKAVMWSSCVLLLAYCSVPAADQQHQAEVKVAAAKTTKSPWAY